MNHLLQAKKTRVKPDIVTKFPIYPNSNDCFAILKDNITVLGVSSTNLSNKTFTILCQKFFDQNHAFSQRLIGNRNALITCFLINEDLNTILVGDKTSNITQYDLETGRLIKKYINLSVPKTSKKKFLFDDRVNQSCCAMIGPLAIFGVSNFLRIIDLNRKTIVIDCLETTVEQIWSVSICVFKENKTGGKEETKVYVCVTGCIIKYWPSKSDIFDITQLVANINISNKKAFSKKSNKKRQKSSSSYRAKGKSVKKITNKKLETKNIIKNLKNKKTNKKFKTNNLSVGGKKLRLKPHRKKTKKERSMDFDYEDY